MSAFRGRAFKRPYRGGEANDNAGLSQQNHVYTSKSDLPQRAVSKSNIPLTGLDLQGRLQATNAHNPEEDECTLQQHVQLVISSVQESDAHCDEGNDHRRMKANPCFEWEKTSACARGDACWYRHDAKRTNPLHRLWMVQTLIRTRLSGDGGCC
ncbi:hypothetical protein FA13DRAFT_1741257 [Coprinellus micaceus]|uniref:C3H1-type domain-containing protein n=1 Tax=Coprinellus micaceus TaxID=71717 RepID=A0A4Y7SJX8_COPMI|nr:hypothetical protein FA13DRAFT_1741257 [Coprinellus micaceus]